MLNRKDRAIEPDASQRVDATEQLTGGFAGELAEIICDVHIFRPSFNPTAR
jgi:hypothetical protein